MPARFDSSYSGIGELLNSDLIVDVMRQIAEKAMALAVARAPVGIEDDSHRGRYKASFEVEVKRHGGVKGDRAEGTLRNFAPEAFYVEKGTSKQRAHHIVLRSMYEAAGSI